MRSFVAKTIAVIGFTAAALPTVGTSALPLPTLPLPLPTAPVEISALRGRDVTQFRMPDTTVRAVFQDGVHYLDDTGTWSETDLRYRADGASQVADRSEVVRVVSGADLSLRSRTTGSGITWRFSAPITVSGTAATVAEDGLTWRYENIPNGVKAMSAPVAARRGPQMYDFGFSVPAGTALSVGAAGDIVSADFVIPRAEVLGADGSRYAASAWSLASGSASFSFDDTVVPDAALPYVVDPTTAWTPSSLSGDGYFQLFPGSYPATTEELLSGTGTDTGDAVFIRKNGSSTTYNLSSGFMQWDVSRIPTTGHVLAARIRAYSYASAPTDGTGRSLCADWYVHGPTVDVTDFDVDPSCDANRTPLSSVAGAGAGTAHVFPLSAAAAHIDAQPIIGVRWGITGNQPCSSCANGMIFKGRLHGAFGGAGQAPTLEVDYCDLTSTSTACLPQLPTTPEELITTGDVLVPDATLASELPDAAALLEKEQAYLALLPAVTYNLSVLATAAAAASPTRPGCPDGTCIAPQGKLTVNGPIHPQDTGFTCGPAASRNMIEWLTGTDLGEAALRAEEHTDDYGATTWWHLRNALNNHLTHEYEGLKVANPTELMGRVTTDISRYRVPVVMYVRLEELSYYNGHPGGHYNVAFGYNHAGGGFIKIADQNDPTHWRPGINMQKYCRGCQPYGYHSEPLASAYAAVSTSLTPQSIIW